MPTVIKCENLSKAYQIGEFSTGTLSQDIERWWIRLRGKQDPFFKIGETNDRASKGDSNIVWSLKDLNFEVNKGEAVGIIGRNGAGKSTLLKILSRVTTPTTGSVKLNGRVASLLEVGTGFHPELTGKENIYLNGAILGMRRHEIARKFDEIVEFAGVARYINTPVKRYSSGMYVRLAFAVAAHLEPEILIVDEVLAVGDSEFQKKCIGKMGEVSKNEGRTILFVSHNMAAIKQLCTKGILLNYGSIACDGEISLVAERYLDAGVTTSNEKSWGNGEFEGNENISLKRVAAFAKGKSTFDPIMANDEVVVELEYELKMENVKLDLTWDLYDMDGVHIFHVGTLVENGVKISSGFYGVRFVIPANLLNTKKYFFNVTFGIDQRYIAYKVDALISINIEEVIDSRRTSFHKFPGAIHPKFHWETFKLESYA